MISVLTMEQEEHAASAPAAQEAGDDSSATPAVADAPPPATSAATQTITFGKQAMTVSLPTSRTVAELKQDIETHTVAACMLSLKSSNPCLCCHCCAQLRDEQTLAAAGLKNGSKVIVMGSRLSEIQAAAAHPSSSQAGAALEWDATKKEVWSEQEQHKKVLAKGRPDDGWAGVKDRQASGRAWLCQRRPRQAVGARTLLQGTRVRLTFKPELQQIWVGSAQSTQKIYYGSISKIEAQPIKGDEGYSIVCMQLGSAATSRLWIYYVPSQAVSGIKLRILGLEALL
eukprot:scaffold24.g2923.t1